MRRIYFILVAILGVAMLWWKFSSTERRAAETIQTNSTAALKSPPKPKVTERSIEQATPATNSVADEGEVIPVLSPEQIAAYLLKYNRNAESLLTAFSDNRDPALLKEAAEKFPNDPRVQLAVLMEGKLDHELTPEERKLWLDRFKTNAPANGLPNLLAALDSFKDGQTDRAVAEVKDSNAKAGLSGFQVEQLQSRVEMYLNAGFSPQEANEKAMQHLDVSLEAKMKAVAQQLGDMQKNYLAAGDTTSANKIAALESNFGHRWADPNSSPFIISELVGIAIQSIALRNLDSNTYYDFLGKTAGERIVELKAQRAEIKTRVVELKTYYGQMTEQDKLNYMNRLKMSGERSAWNWLRQMYGTNGGTAQP